MTTNIFVRDLDLGAPIADARCPKVVADGLPLHGGRQLAIDTTLVSTLKSNCEPRRRTAVIDGAVLEVARRQKERTYPELWAHAAVQSWWSLLARSQEGWSTETLTFLSKLAKAKSRDPATFVCDDAESKRGGCVGAPFSPAQRPGRSPLLSLV